MRPNNRKPDDPYNGFSDDRERRRALGTRERWRYGGGAVAAVAIALMAPGNTERLFTWLKILFP